MERPTIDFPRLQGAARHQGGHAGAASGACGRTVDLAETDDDGVGAVDLAALPTQGTGELTE